MDQEGMQKGERRGRCTGRFEGGIAITAVKTFVGP